MINSNENIGDRPVRRHFNGIVLSAMAFMALFLLLAILFFHFKQPAIAHPSKTPSSAQPAPSQPQ